MAEERKSVLDLIDKQATAKLLINLVNISRSSFGVTREALIIDRVALEGFTNELYGEER